MISNPQIRKQDQAEPSLEADLPETVGFEEAEMSPEMAPMAPAEMGPAAPVPQAGGAVPAELAPPEEMTAGDSFFDLRPANMPAEPEADSVGGGSETALEAPTSSGADVNEGMPAPSAEWDQDALLAHNSALAAEVQSLREQLQKDGSGVPAAEISDLQARLGAEVMARQTAQEDLRQAREELQFSRSQQTILTSELDSLRAAAPTDELAKLKAALEAESVARRTAEEDLRVAREEIQNSHSRQAALASDLEAQRSARGSASEATQAVSAELAKAHEEIARLKAGHDEAAANIERIQRANEELTAKLSQAQTQAQDSQHAHSEAMAAIQNRDAEITRLHAEISQAAPAPAAKGKAGDHEAQIKALKKDLAAKEKELRETREQLDSESARSFRLSQRRIPALQNELAEAHAQGMELRRKMEKVEAEKRTLADNAESTQRQVEELERALQAAKARLQDTAIIAPPDSQPSPADEEVKRLAARLKAAEEERRKLSESLAQIDKGRRGELEKYEQRLAATQAESNERHENFLGLRKQLKLLAGRLSQSLKLAAMLASAADEEQRRMILEGIEKLARESDAIASGQTVDLAALAPPPSQAHADDTTRVRAVPVPADKGDSSRTEVVSKPPEMPAPAAPAADAAPPVATPADLVEPTAEPMSLDGPSLEPGLDGIPDDIGGPNTDL